MSDRLPERPLQEMHESMHDAMSLDGDPGRLKAYYDEWACEYDDDVGVDYGMPSVLVAALLAAIADSPELHRYGPPEAHVLDAGCGTGLVGVELARAGYRVVDGVDLSPEMVVRASERNIYRRLGSGVDLSVGYDSVDGESIEPADVVTVGGVFTVGHLPPESLGAVVTFARPGGLIALSTRRAYHEQTRFNEMVDELIERGEVQLVHHVAEGPYTMDSTGDYWVFRRRPASR